MKSNLLFWKITGVFTSLLVILGVTYIVVASWMAKRNFNAINEQLYGDIAPHLASSTHPLKDGKPDTAVTHDIIHSIMVINPSVEVYLLDTTGRIIDFVVPDRSVRIPRVDLHPIQQYISEQGRKYLTGDNPKNPQQKSIFSAAPIFDGPLLKGYVYAILASEKQSQIAAALNHNFFYSLGTVLFFCTLVGAFLVGVVIFYLITGSIRRMSAIVNRFKDGDHTARIEGDLGILATTFNEMADTIVDNMQQLSSMDKLRQELIANVSHDLRSPLAITQGYVETLMIKGNDITGIEKDRYLAIILNSLKKLSHLVGQLFEYSKLEANQIRPNKEPFLMTDLVSDMVQHYDIIARGKDVTLRLEAPRDLPPVLADIALVERAIQNLLDNALKFTPPKGKITITLLAKTKGVEIAIADTGTGIPLKDQPYIFERYKQFPAHELQNKEGMGLGLAIVKKIIELHHSVINIRSLPGSGTVFWFQLPTTA
ncbi:HAMP domain-containing sensor histidine kinase [Dinghuibacter silviterrae]|uniref:histidine kinase n=1 Tax=Dinghuibacter silviterrae TaxID=1539049 RepID=A0A4R8DPN0_9BACT|nr:HAMP domain-containing sensor histidine kinase [Dinghuibacter silviterrae]TDW99080.1 signal transduction histidine kinase [Dinghuibacter silviterrae]